MPDFPAYSREELEQRGRDLLRTRRRGADVAYGSDYDLWSRILGALAWAQQKHAQTALRLLDMRQAFGAFLGIYAREAGLGRTLSETSVEATPARGTVIVLSTTGGQMQPAGSVLRHADGTEYTLDADVTTSLTAAKVLRVGHRSGPRRLYQGHSGTGFVLALEGEVYLATRTGEVCALRAVDNASALMRHLFELYNALDEVPEIHDTFVQQFGAVAQVTARRGGTVGIKDPKDVLELVAPVGTMLSDVHILSLLGGDAAMSPAAIQARLRSLYGTRAGTGTLADLRAIALACPEVLLDDCYIAPATSGIGSYTLFPIGAEGPFLGESEQSLLLEHMRANSSPVDKFEGAAIYEEVDTEIDFLSVQVSDIYRPDWTLPDEGEHGIPITLSGTSAIALARVPPGLGVGARIVITTRGASGPYLVQRRITAIDALTVELDAPLPFPPDVGDSFVTPGGALGEAILAALYEAYAARAPSLGHGGTAIRFPAAPTTDDAQGVLGAVARVEGVLDVAYGAGPQPNLSTRGGMLVPGCVVRMYAGGAR